MMTHAEKLFTSRKSIKVLKAVVSIMTILVLSFGNVVTVLLLTPSTIQAGSPRGGTDYARDTGRDFDLDGTVPTGDTTAGGAADVAVESPKGPFDDIGAAISRVYNKIRKLLGTKITTALDAAFKVALRNFARRLAYDAAVRLASGATGQKPLFKQEFNFQEDFDAAVGDFLNNSVGKLWGKDLCEPLDSLVKVNLEISARQILEPNRPSCGWAEIRDNFESLSDVTLIDFPKAAEIFNPEGNDLGILLKITSGALTAGQQSKENEQSRLVAEGGFRSIVDPVTGQIKTPAGIVERFVTHNLIEVPFKVETVRSDNPWVNAADLFISTFINTLAANLMRLAFDKGFSPDTVRRPADFGASGGIAAARQRFADLLLPDLRTGGPAAILAELEACETTADQQPSANNCVIDRSLFTAIQDQMTVGQALETGLLHADWAFGAIGGSAGTGSSDLSEQDGLYSLRSITILRKYGIVPVGWEIAARYIVEVGRQAGGTGTQYTLNDDDGLTSAAHYNNPQSPFYHLIDKKWVLKAPEVFARRRGIGPIISHFQPIPVLRDGQVVTRDVPIRLEYNADERTCIQEDNNGNCSRFGYCTEYRNSWRIKPGTVCEEDAVSCQSFVNPTGAMVNYLQSTLDHGAVGTPQECSAINAGCAWYCLAYDTALGDWSCADQSTGTIVRLNRNILEQRNLCTERAAGCSRLIQLTDPDGDPLDEAGVQAAIDQVAASETNLDQTQWLTYSQLTDITATNRQMRLPPDYLLCNDIDPLNDSAECDQYALQCTPEEVDCELFTPVKGIDPVPIPAIVNATTLPTDQCPAECVGYDRFMEQPTFFDSPRTASEQKLIPERQQECSAEFVGCEEFTNLDKLSAGGEAREYYFEVQACIQQGSGAAVNTYYSWQGSDEAGFQLRVWKLLESNVDPGPCTNGRNNPTTGGTECYDNLSDPNIPGGPVLAQATCGPETPDPNDDPGINPACIQFIDENFDSYWRIASQTVEESASCVPIRRTLDDSVWNIVPGRGRQCPAEAAGCRQYKGSDSYGYRLVPLGDTRGREDFSDGDTNGWIPVSNATITPSAESPLAQGSSALVNGGINTWVADLGSTCTEPAGCQASIQGLSCKVPQGAQKCGLLHKGVKQGQRYVLSFWAKAAGTTAVPVFIAGYPGRAGVGGFVFVNRTGGSSISATKWQQYSFGPVEYTRPLEPTEYLNIDFSGQVYITNIELRETTDLYIIKEVPWDVPASCTDQFLGCAQYKDSENKDWYFTQFSNLCREDVVGCTLFVDTHNSTKASAEVFNADNTDAIDDWTVLKDTISYWVDDSKKYCNSQDVGCAFVGQGTTNRNGLTSFTDRFLKLNPDNFDNTMCHTEEVWCQEYRFANEQGGLEYFKDPLDRVCVRTEVNKRMTYCADTGAACTTSAGCATGLCVTSPVTGWSKLGSQDLCSIDGDTSFVAYCDPKAVNSPDCYVKGCDGNASSCTSYRDPQDPPNCNTKCPLTFDTNGQPKSVTYDPITGVCVPGCTGGPGCAPGCQTYYFLRDSVDDSSCNGVIDPAAGCVPFFDTGLERAETFISECQPGCTYSEDTSGNPVFVDEDCNLSSVADGGKPGCIGIVPE